MVMECEREFNGPEYTFIDAEDTRLVRKTLCSDRDCDIVLREDYNVERLIHVDSDETFPPMGGTCEELLTSLENQLNDCDDQSRVITDIPSVTLSHGELHDDSFSVLYEYPEDEEVFLLYFEQTRIAQRQTSLREL